MTDIRPPNWDSCKDITLEEDIKSDLQEISDIGANKGIKQMAQKILLNLKIMSIWVKGRGGF